MAESGTDAGSDAGATLDAPRPAGFECVGNVTWPPAPAATADLTFRAFHGSADWGDPADWGPFEGLTFAACAEGSDCASPLDSGTTDPSGVVTLTVPTPGLGFEGYVRATGTGAVPIEWRYHPPLASADARWLLPDMVPVVFTPTSLAGAASMIGSRAIEPGRGHVVVTTGDCLGALSAVISVTVDGARPDASDSGDSVFWNVAPGDVEIVGTLRATGEVLGRVHAPVRAGAVTAVYFVPMP